MRQAPEHSEPPAQTFVASHGPCASPQHEGWCSMMRTTCLLVLVALTTSPEPSSLGPPLICWKIDIGTAESLPWGETGIDMAKDFPTDKVVPETLRILQGSDDPLVHMETLRRAVFY